MRLNPTFRRLLLALHLGASVGWIGAACAYLALAFAIPATDDPQTVRAAWIGMELIGWYALIPLALVSLASGTWLALASRWGLLRHYWVLISFIGTVVLTLVMVLHMPDVSAQAEVARAASTEHLAVMGSDIAHALIGCVLLVGIMVLNLYKPKGLTQYGWRRERADRGPTATRATA